MKSTTLLAAILADLKTFATELKGRCHLRPVLAKDPFHTLQILSLAPQGLYLIVQDDGDAPTPGTDPEDTEFLRQAFSVFVAINHGVLQAEPAADLLEERGDRPSLTELCDLTRTRVMSLGQEVSDAGDLSRSQYIGRIAVATPDGLPLSAYQLRFRMDYATDPITYRDP